MPDISTYLLPEDILEIASGCLTANCGLVPDRNYETPEYRVLCATEAVRQEMQESWPPAWFVVSTRWERCPLEMGSFEKEGRRRYFVMQKNGGPTIDIFAGRPLRDSVRKLLPGTSIAYHPRFWNWRTEQNERPSKELVACFRKIRRRIIQSSHKVVLMKQAYYVSHRAARSGLQLGPPLEHLDLATLRGSG